MTPRAYNLGSLGSEILLMSPNRKSSSEKWHFILILPLLYHFPFFSANTSITFVEEIELNRSRVEVPTSTTKERVALCLYGLISRSLKYTHISIKENIIDSLKSEGYKVDLFAHSLSLETLSNPRSNERGKILNSSEIFLLDYHDYLVENQTKVDHRLNFPVFEKYGSAWEFQGDKTFNSLHNLLRQLYSLRGVWNLMNRYAVSHQLNYSAVILARPDCYYESKVSLRQMNISDNTVYIPTYFKIPRQLNDRFAIGSMKSSYIISHRIESALAFCEGTKVRPLHSESLVYYHLQKQNISATIIPLHYCRIRAGGSISKDFCQDLKEISRRILSASSRA